MRESLPGPPLSHIVMGSFAGSLRDSKKPEEAVDVRSKVYEACVGFDAWGGLANTLLRKLERTEIAKSWMGTVCALPFLLMQKH